MRNSSFDARDHHLPHLRRRLRGSKSLSDVASEHHLLRRPLRQKSKNKSSSDAANDPSLLLQDNATLKRKRSSSDEGSESHPENPLLSRSLCQSLSEIPLLHHFNLCIVLQLFRRSLPITDISIMVSKEHVHQRLHHPLLQVHLQPCHRLVRKIWKLKSGDVVCAMVKTFMKRMSYMSVIGRYVRLLLPKHLHHLKSVRNSICKSLVVVQCQRTKAVKETIGETLDVSFAETCGQNWQRIW